MAKVQFDALDVGYVENKLAQLQGLLWEAVNYVQGFGVIQRECEDSIEELKIQLEKFPDDEAKIQRDLDIQTHNLEKNLRKLESQKKTIDYLQGRIGQVKAILDDAVDFEVETWK